MGKRTGVEVREKSIRLFFVTADGVTNRRTIRVDGQPIKPTVASIKFAQRLAVEVRAKIEAGVFRMAEYFPADAAATVGRGGTLGSQLTGWVGSQRIEASTKAGYESAAKFWSNAIVDGAPLGVRRLEVLRHSDIMRALATKPSLSGKTVNNYVSVLKEALQMAVLDKAIAENPAAQVPRAKWQKPVVDPFSPEEVAAIIAAVEEGPVRNMVEAWMFTGMRTSEVFGLKWSNVDLAAATILVCEVNVRGVEKDRTKTAVARTVRLNSRALAAIQRQAEAANAIQLLAGASPDDHVFTDPRYKAPWNEERAFRRSYWEPALSAAGVRYRRPYNMRHTHATRMLMAGMKAPFCAKQLGHSVEVFHSTYAKWMAGDADDLEMARLEASL